MLNKIKNKLGGPGKDNKTSKKPGAVDGMGTAVGVAFGGDATGAGVAPSVAQAVAVNHANKKRIAGNLKAEEISKQKYGGQPPAIDSAEKTSFAQSDPTACPNAKNHPKGQK
ncbi:hypothetical protein Slin15195_G076950 [Septoria linicola]|uniref:Uncharacterized protein n=1 Tax=Septoria linicola TaxID=215465 RepID=A0A9Q9EK26_9PEZI|nr:hypothetical protein Slin15195_G076950 [Septoria linicola]